MNNEKKGEEDLDRIWENNDRWSRGWNEDEIRRRTY
jgi:hypothetical protein